MQADEIMVEQVASVAPTDSVAVALEVLAGIDARHVPVLDDGELVGMLSDRDLRALGVYRVRDAGALERIQALVRTPVSEVMSADVHSVPPGADVHEVIELMLEERIGAVPVVDPHTQEVVGIISYVDVLRATDRLLATA